MRLIILLLTIFSCVASRPPSDIKSHQSSGDTAIDEIFCHWQAGETAVHFEIVTDATIDVGQLNLPHATGLTLVNTPKEKLNTLFLFCMTTDSELSLKKVVQINDQFWANGLEPPVDGSANPGMMKALFADQYTDINFVLKDPFEPGAEFLVRGWESQGKSFVTLSRTDPGATNPNALTGGKVSAGKLNMVASVTPPAECEIEAIQILEAGTAKVTFEYCFSTAIHSHGGPGYEFHRVIIADSNSAIPENSRNLVFKGEDLDKHLTIVTSHHHLLDSFIVRTSHATYALEPKSGDSQKFRFQVKYSNSEALAEQDVACIAIYGCNTGIKRQ
jgi:hypothetical protein